MPVSVPSRGASGARLVHKYRTVLGRWFWLLGLCLLLGGVGAFVASKSIRPVYRATTFIIVDERAQVAGQDPYTGLLASVQLITTYQGLIPQPAVLQRAAKQVGGVSASALAGRVSVKNQAGSQILEVSVDDTNPDRAAGLANAIVASFIAVQHDSMMAEYQHLQEQFGPQERNLTAEIATLDKQISALQSANPQDPRLASLEQQLTSDTAELSGLYAETANLQSLATSNDIRVFQPAIPPTTPDHPKPLLNVAIGGALGLIVAVILIGLLEYFDDRIRTPQQAEERLGMPVLTTVGAYPRRSLLLGISSSGRLGRDIDTLLANLYLDTHPRSIAVTSAGPAEGRTTIAINLAIALARAGKRVALLDGDLHERRIHARAHNGSHVSIHEMLGTPIGFGLSLVMTEKSHDNSPPYSMPGIPNLYVLPAGPKIQDPSDVFRSGRFRRYLQSLVEGSGGAQIDVVVIDTPPATDYPDATLLAKWVDATILVVDATQSHEESALRVKNMLERSHARIAGVVLNRTHEHNHAALLARYQPPPHVEEHPYADGNGLVREKQHGFFVAAAFPSGERENGNAHGLSASGAPASDPLEQ